MKVSPEQIDYLISKKALANWREEIRVKAGWELSVHYWYEHPRGTYTMRAPVRGGLLTADGKPATKTIRVNAGALRLGLPPLKTRTEEFLERESARTGRSVLALAEEIVDLMKDLRDERNELLLDAIL